VFENKPDGMEYRCLVFCWYFWKIFTFFMSAVEK